MKWYVIVWFNLICFNVVVTIDQKEICKTCVRTEKCAFYGQMTKVDQDTWISQHSCDNEEEDVGILFGFAPVAKGDYICCPAANVWGIEGENIENTEQKTGEHEQGLDANENDEDEFQENADDVYEQNRAQNDRHSGFNRMGNRRNNKRRPVTHESVNQGKNNFNNPDNRYPNSNSNIPIQRGPDVRPSNNFNRPQGNDNTNIFPSGSISGGNQNTYSAPSSFYRPQNNSNFPINRQPYYPNFNNPQNNVPINGVPPQGKLPNSNQNQLQNGNTNNQNQLRNGNTNNQGRFLSSNNNNQFNGSPQETCAATISTPPEPRSGCCGKDASSGRVNGVQNNFMNRRPAGNQNGWMPGNPMSYPGQNRFSRAADNETVDFSVDNRITGGTETEVHDFPWLVLLKTTFDYGTKQAAFNCGGSVVSSRYVLTAAHCVQEDEATVSGVDVYLAEYDKRSFPNDCVNVLGEGRKCIENIVIRAENVIPHAQYDDRKLQNDIALVRLRENAPYTEYIRPICLPPIDIDNPEYSNLRVAIAGWGRNGRFTSQVKQSAVVNLVPQRECSDSYPQLTRRHLCAQGRSGEDTCKGDSGGPLMMLYEGQYYISGVVSGKRADAPCGTAVPSLYTNVYHYLHWIRSNMRN